MDDNTALITAHSTRGHVTNASFAGAHIIFGMVVFEHCNFDGPVRLLDTRPVFWDCNFDKSLTVPEGYQLDRSNRTAYVVILPADPREGSPPPARRDL
jgi:hypothetical protein